MSSITLRFMPDIIYTFNDEQPEKEKQSEAKREQGNKTKLARQLSQISDETDAFINKLQAQQKESTLSGDILLEQGTTLKFRLNVLLQNAQQAMLQTGGESVRRNLEAVQVLLSRLAVAEDQWIDTDSQTSNVSTSSVISKKALTRVSPLLSSLQQASKATEQPNPLVASSVMGATTEKANSPERDVDAEKLSDIAARQHSLPQQVVNILLQNPLACRRTIGTSEPAVNAAYPSLTPPTHQPMSLQQLLVAVMKLVENTATLTTDIQSKISDLTRELATAITIDALKKNEETLRKQKDAEEKTKRISTIFKWIVRALNIIVGALTAFTPVGALLLAVSIVDIALEETAGFSIMGTLMKPVMMLFEQLTKIFVKLLEACGAKGVWVEAVSMVITMALMFVVTRGAAKLGLTRAVGNLMKKVITTIVKKVLGKFPEVVQKSGKQLFLAISRSLTKAMSVVKVSSLVEKAQVALKWLESKLLYFITFGQPVVQTVGELTKLPSNIKLSKLQIEQSENEAEMSDADFLNELVMKLLKGIREPLDKMLADRETLTDMATNLQRMENRVNNILTGNIQGLKA